MVYALPDVLDKPCVWLARILYKCWRRVEVSRSAHSFLWICMGLSTVDASWRQPVASERERFSDLANQSRTWPGWKCGFPPTDAASNEKNFFGRTARSTSGLQPKSVYKDSSSVNNCHFLWISLLTDKKSVVYARYKPVICCCMFLVANLDKNRDRGKSRVFAQTVPVDIKKLIHTCPSGASFTIW
jgi:hypothetical protein